MRGGVTMTEENEQMSGMKVPKEDFIERLQQASTEIDSIKNSFSKGMEDIARIQSIISLDGVNKLTTMVQDFEDKLIDAERKREEASEGARKFSTELEKEKERLVKLWDAYKNQEEELSIQEKHASELEDRLRDVENSKNQIEQDVTSRLNTLSQKLEEKDQHIQQLQEFEKQATDFQNARAQLEQNVNQLNHDVNAKEEMIRSLEVQVDELRQFEQMAEFKTKFEDVANEYEKEKERLTKLETKKTNIKKLGPEAHCPTCNRILGTQSTTLHTHFKDEITTHQKELATLQQKTTDLTTQKDQINRQKNALTKKITYLTQQNLETERLQTKIQSLQTEITREQQKHKTLTQEYQKLQKINFNTQRYKKIYTQINKTYDAYQKLLTQQTTLQQKRENLRITLESTKGQQKIFQQNITTKKQQIEEQKTHLKTLKTIKEQHQQLKLLHEIMTGFRTHIISQIRPLLTQYASELFHTLTDGKYSAVELDENYTLMIYDNGRAHPINRFSGGEEDLANLCIRLAISEVIAERAGSIFQFIILDEIFGSQDAYRRQNIINTLNRFSIKFRQIFLITHIEEIKHHMEHTLTVLENETGISIAKLE